MIGGPFYVVCMLCIYYRYWGPLLPRYITDSTLIPYVIACDFWCSGMFLEVNHSHIPIFVGIDGCVDYHIIKAYFWICCILLWNDISLIPNIGEEVNLDRGVLFLIYGHDILQVYLPV